MSTTGSAANSVGECIVVIIILNKIFRRYSRNHEIQNNLLWCDGKSGLTKLSTALKALHSVCGQGSGSDSLGLLPSMLAQGCRTDIQLNTASSPE